MNKQPTGKLKFKAKDILPLIEHALSSKEFNPTMSEAYNLDFTRKSKKELKAILKPALHLVKDRGVYLMSNGAPSLKKWQMDKKFEKLIYTRCELYKKRLLKNKEFWRDRVEDFVIAVDMHPIEFTSKFQSKEESYGMENHCHVIYAEGLNPDDYNYSDKAKEDCFDKARRICGGDDFCQLIDNELMLTIKRMLSTPRPKYLVITMYEDSFTIGI